MAIKETPRAIIDVLDSEGNITGHEIEVFVTYEAEGPDDPMLKLGFQSKVERQEATPERVAELRKKSSDGLTDANNKLNAQIAQMQQDHAAAIAILQSDLNAALVQAQEARSDADKAVGLLSTIRKALA